MMKKICMISFVLHFAAAGSGYASGNDKKAAEAAPAKVYMTRDISPAGMKAVYEALGRKYRKALRREVLRLALLADDALEGAVVEKAMENLGEEELMALREGYERRAAKRYPLRPQLPRRGQREEAPVSQAEFQV